MQQKRAVVALTGLILLIAVAQGHAQTYTVEYSYPIGAGAYSGITFPQIMSQGRDGNLYGTISNNGTKSVGTVFKMTTSGAWSSVYSFCALTSCGDGSYPFGGVSLGFDGNLWGTTQTGGTGGAGTAFKVTPTGTLTTMHSFINGTDDSVPVYTMFQGQDGNMYGISVGEYNGQDGAFFRISSTGTFTVLHDFVFTDGADPNLPTQGTDGNFYGTATLGGTKNLGVVYKISPGGKVTVLHSFTGDPSDGSLPKGILVEGNDGNLYGTTYEGGSNNNGTVFQITPGGVLTVIHNFVYLNPSFDGRLPEAGLTLGPDGNFYGVTTAGGTKNAGILFQVTPAGAETVLYNFCDPSCNGFSPATPLVLHTDGNLYGNTNGNSLGGSVFYRLSMGFNPLVDLVTWQAKVGKTVEILGQGFTGTAKVLFGSTPATFKSVSDTYMTATVPAGATTGPVTVTTFTTSYVSNRSFLVTPQLTSFTPSSGTVGTTVTINGVSLSQTSNITIGGKAAAFTVVSDTQLTATVPAGAKTGQPIVVTTPGGTVSSSGQFAIVPLIKGFNPTSGPVGTSVTIAGNSFTGATGVTFGGVAATSFDVINDTKVNAEVPSGAVTGKITVTTPGGTGTSTTNFTVTQ